MCQRGNSYWKETTLNSKEGRYQWSHVFDNLLKKLSGNLVYPRNGHAEDSHFNIICVQKLSVVETYTIMTISVLWARNFLHFLTTCLVVYVSKQP